MRLEPAAEHWLDEVVRCAENGILLPAIDFLLFGLPVCRRIPDVADRQNRVGKSEG